MVLSEVATACAEAVVATTMVLSQTNDASTVTKPKKAESLEVPTVWHDAARKVVRVRLTVLHREAKVWRRTREVSLGSVGAAARITLMVLSEVATACAEAVVATTMVHSQASDASMVTTKPKQAESLEVPTVWHDAARKVARKMVHSRVDSAHSTTTPRKQEGHSADETICSVVALVKMALIVLSVVRIV